MTKKTNTIEKSHISIAHLTKETDNNIDLPLDDDKTIDFGF